MSSRTTEDRSPTLRSLNVARSPTVNRRPSEEAATATRSAIAGSRARRRRISPLVRVGIRSSVRVARPDTTAMTRSSARPRTSSTSRNGLPRVRSTARSKASSGLGREQIRHDLLDRFVAQHVEHDLRCSVRHEFGQRCVHLR